MHPSAVGSRANCRREEPSTLASTAASWLGLGLGLVAPTQHLTLALTLTLTLATTSASNCRRCTRAGEGLHSSAAQTKELSYMQPVRQHSLSSWLGLGLGLGLGLELGLGLTRSAPARRGGAMPRLNLADISPRSRLDVPYISRRPRLQLHYVSPMPPLHLPYISPISRLHCAKAAAVVGARLPRLGPGLR